MSPAPSNDPLRGLPGWLLLLSMLCAIGPLSIDMYLPSLPTIAAELRADAGAMQRTLSTFFIGLALGQIIYGPLSDRFGRKPPLYVGLLLYTLAALGCALAESVQALQGWRLLQALGGCVGMVTARAVIRDRCDARGMARAYSLVMLVMGAAPILAPLVGGAILQWLGWRAIFAILAMFGVGALAVVHAGMEETLDRRHAAALRLSAVLGNYAALLRDRHYMTYVLCGGLIQAALFTYVAASPFVLIELYGIPAAHFGWVFGVNAFGLIAASQINARLLRRTSPPVVLRYALSIQAGCAAVMALLIGFGGGGLWVLLPGLFGVVSAHGCVSPNTAALALQHQGARAGAAAALLGSLQLGMATLASIAVSVWSDGSALPLCVVMACCTAGAWLLHRSGESAPALAGA